MWCAKKSLSVLNTRLLEIALVVLDTKSKMCLEIEWKYNTHSSIYW